VFAPNLYLNLAFRTDLVFGSSKLQYSTAMLMSSLKLGNEDVLVVHGVIGLLYEVALEFEVQPLVTISGTSKVKTSFNKVRRV
jgi:hypothetical protein